MSGQKMNGKSNSDNEDWENKKSDIRQQTCLFVCLLDCLFELGHKKCNLRMSVDLHLLGFECLCQIHILFLGNSLDRPP